jgi:hypothetical protein
LSAAAISILLAAPEDTNLLIDKLQAIKFLTKKLPTDGVVNWRGKFNHYCTFFDRVETVFTWRSAFLAMLEAARALIRETESFGVVCTFTEHSALRAKVL